MRLLAFACAALSLTGCLPVVGALALLAATAEFPETENFFLSNQVDDFYVKADHHGYCAVETYEWHNRGETAAIEGGAKPSCTNDVTVKLFDAEDDRVLQETFHAPHCFKDDPEHWLPRVSAAGTPGIWRIEMTYCIEGVTDMWFHIWRLGEPLVEGGVEERVDGRFGDDAEHRDRGCQVVRWNSTYTVDRDVEESYVFKVGGPTAIVDLRWTVIDSGTMEITILDDYGEVIYHRILDPATEPPIYEVTAPGHPGHFTATLKATGLTSTGLEIYIEG